MAKTVVITGASSGIGAACAEIYAKNGYNLILTARRNEKLRSVAESLEKKYGSHTTCYVFDVRDAVAVDGFGKDIDNSHIIPDVFINNAGLAWGTEPIYDGDFKKWDTMIDTNVKGFLYCARAIIPLMMRNNAGSIINLSSIAGTQVYPGGNVYNATKFAVRALSQAMNFDLLKTNIRVCSIEPGAVETEFSLVRFDWDKEKADNVYKGFQPLTGSDIAEIIYFVTSLPAHINIQNLMVTPTAQRSAMLFNRENL